MTRMPRISGDGRGRQVAGVAGLGLAQAVAAALAALATREAFAALRLPWHDTPVWPVPVILLAGIAIAAFQWSEKLAAEALGQRYAAALRQQLFRHISGLSSSAVSRHRAGSLSLRFVGDLTAVRAWVSQGIARLLSAAVVLPCAIAVLYILQPLFGHLALALLLLSLAGLCLLGPGLETHHRRLRRQRARLAGDLAERLPKAPELKLLGRFNKEQELLTRRNRNLIHASLSRQRHAALLRAIPEIFRAGAAAGIILAALKYSLSGAETAGALAAVALMIRPLRHLAGIWDRRAAWQVARKRCQRVFASPQVAGPAPVTPPKTGKAWRKPPQVTFSGVSTSRLKNLDAVIPAGRKIGITGPNGAGKSSLLALVAGLEAPSRGRLLINRSRPTELPDRLRRNLLSLLNDRSPILAGSLRRALTMGLSPRPADTAIVRMAHRFELGDLLKRAGGLDGQISEGGRNLSSGEKKRVQLARAALSQRPLLLLDEPDEALDQAGRRQLRELIRTSPATVLMVTHDLTLLAACDEIWLLDKGRLVERGAPEQLPATKSWVARDFELDKSA